jgi:hypothetical protein
MKSEVLTERVRIASPCKAEWSAMEGDDRSRFCRACSKFVYDFSALTTAEIEALVRAKEGRVCARVYRRRDGRMLTADCPVGHRARRRRNVVALVAAGLGFVIASAFGALGPVGARCTKSWTSRLTALWDGGASHAPEPTMGMVVIPGFESHGRR